MALIYIVEDDKNIREIESFAIKNSGYEVEDFERAKEFNSRILEKLPDLILLDIMLPDEDGLSILKRLRQLPETRKIPIMLVTAKTTEIDKVRGLDWGADDYLVKPFGVMELISRVKALLRRSSGMEEEQCIEYKNIVLHVKQHKVTIEGEICELTYKEFKLLKLFLLNAGIVLSRDIIMEKIWGMDYEGELIKTVRNVGYKLE